MNSIMYIVNVERAFKRIKSVLTMSSEFLENGFGIELKTIVDLYVYEFGGVKRSNFA